MSTLAAMSNVADGRRMKSELQELRRRGALRPSASEDCPVGDTRSCNRCRAELGWIVNRGAVCQACRLRVCKACREYTVRTVDWVCTVCYKRSQIQTATGEWMNEYIKKPGGQWKDNKFYMSAADIIKSTIRRSWTICDPNPRWPTSRDSPDFRPYNSLPRGRDVTDFPSLVDNNDKRSISPDTTKKDDYESRSEGYSPKHRRVSQFERTLSELYGSQKKTRRSSTSDDSNGVEKSPNEPTLPPPPPPTNEMNKKTELKPTKIPSPRKKIQYTRSETLVVSSDSPKQQIKKHLSLQTSKKYASKEKLDDSAAIQEKRVSFDDECSKKTMNENICSKSGIPKREIKHRNYNKSETKPESISLQDKIEMEPSIEQQEEQIEINESAVENSVIETVSDDTEKCDLEPLSGAVFRKVTIKRRRHDFKKTQAFDEGVRRKQRYSETARDDLLDLDPGSILLPDCDDYKLVFISSDSSSKEEEIDDNDSVSSSSATTGHSFTIDDCDWDYFEPSSGVKPVLCWSNRNSPFGSPRVYRRGVLDSPIGSPLVYRRARESDTGTDEDVTHSPASSDSTVGFLSRVRSSSETEDHLPMDVGYTENNEQRLQCVMRRGEDTGSNGNTSTASSQLGTAPVVRSPCQSCGAVTTSPPTQFVPIPVLVPIPVPVPALWNPLDPVILYNTSDILDCNLRARLRAIQQRTGALLLPCVNQASLISSLISAGGDGNSLMSVQHSMYTQTVEAETNMTAAFEQNNARTDEHAAGGERVHEPETNEPGSNADNKRRVTITCDAVNSVNAENIGDTSQLIVDGYLLSENTFNSSTETSDNTDSEDEGVGKPRLHRTYNVNNFRDSDDPLSSNVTSCDEDDTRMSHSSDRHESSSIADTDSDEGTVAEQKAKKFSKVFVVNNNDSSSDVDDYSDSSSTDTSDNDTDTECVVLNYIKPIEDSLYLNNCDNGDDSIVLLKHIKSNEDKFSDDNNGIVLLKHVTFNTSEYKTSAINDCDIDTLDNTSTSEQCNIDSTESELSNHIATDQVEETANVDCTIAVQLTNFELIDCTPTTSEEETKQIHLESNMKLSNVIDTPPIGKQIDIERDICETETLFPQEQKYSEALPSGEWNTNTDLEIRSSDPVRWSRDTNRRGYDEVKGESLYARGARTGAPTAVHRDHETAHHVPAARYTSLVMITQESPPVPPHPGICPQVSIVPSDTTTIIPVANNSDVIVQHTNWQDETSDPEEQERSGLADYFTALDNPNNNKVGTPPRKPVHVTKNSVTVVANSDTLVLRDNVRSDIPNDGVIVVTGGDTLSAVVCLEEGLADDDSWVEDISHDEDEFATTTATDSSSGEEVTLGSSMDQEEELRGYHRSAIDFTLHTIVEESCEESEVEQAPKKRPTSATDLEKYFFYRLGNGSTNNINSQDAFSETSSIYSEGMDSLGAAEEVPNDGIDPAELASSRLEKYFLSGFMGFTSERRDSDGSVGSDSEGRPSPEQRRKKLVRARGTGRSHSSSLDNLLANAELSGNEPQSADIQQNGSEDSSSSETDTYDEPSNFEKSDGQFDTVKRKKCKKQRVVSGGSSSPHEDRKGLETTMEESNENNDSDGDEGHKTPQPEFLLPLADLANSRKQQSRDSGFIGSSDDLLRDQRSHSDCSDAPSTKPLELKNDLEKITEEKRDEKTEKMHYYTGPPTTTLTRKDSFNNWSSDEETNLMMSKMRQFFKTMVANNSNVHLNPSSKPTTPVLGKPNPPRSIPSPRTKRNKPPQLVYFENELTRLMKTVPGIRDDQVREIVEYLSSEDTWSDSYDSSDYTSSDLEGTAVAQKSALQQQISASCQQIINKFDKNAGDEEGDEGDGGILDDSQGLNRETAFVYQKLVASFNKIASGQISDTNSSTPHNSPPLIAKVMHHIGSRLVALMHEVSSGESHCSTSPKVRYHHRRLQQKLSSASTTEDDDSTSDSNLPDRLTGLDETSYNLLPRSRSHDLLLGEARAHHQSSSGVSDIAEEREASDYERFSWRGSFESALMATDSRTKLSMIGTEGSASASALAMAAKRRSAGDLLFSPKSLSREQLDRVRSCGSIGGSGNSEEKHWVVTHAVRPNRRRSSVPDATCGSGGSADGEDDDEEDMESRSTLPRSLQTNTATTNSLPRLPTSSNAANMHKAQSMHHFLQHNVKSARYRPPGFNRSVAGTTGPKRAVSAPGLQPSHPRREARRRSQQPLMSSDDLNINESNASPVVAPKSGSKSVSPSPIHGNTLSRGTGSVSSADWQGNEDDIDRLVAMHHNRSSLSSLGLRSDSMASVYSGAGEGRYGIVAVRGQVEFGLQYNYKAGALEIHIKQCKDLAAVDMKRNRSDPYVKVYLLPDKSKGGKRKTKVKKHTLNPVFDECLKFHSTLSGLETRTLWLTVWHSDMFGRNDFLGEVMMPLENKVFDDPSPKWYNLQERTEPFEELPSYKGDIIVGLKFVPPDMTVQKKGKRSRGALHVLVKEAKSLTAVKANGTSDPFCKSYLLPDKGRSNKQKTPIIRRTTNPTWNHTFVYDDVTLQELTDRALELTVWDHDRLASNEFLGGVRFSLGTSKHYGKNVDWMDATGKELSLWQNMLERPNFWVEGCVTLRPSLDNRCT